MTPKEKNVRGLGSLIINLNTFIKCLDLSRGKSVSQTINFHFNTTKCYIISLTCGINFNYPFGQVLGFVFLFLKKNSFPEILENLGVKLI